LEFIPAKQIVTARTNNDNWFGTNYNMNIYKGCSHGCIYCDSRSDCYQIKDFQIVRAKQNAIEIINSELKAKRKKGVVGTGAMSDPYNPLEREYEFTRRALELLNRYNFGVAIATKSDLVTRDIDILKEIKSHSPVIVKITVTIADDELCKKIEPNVASSSRRFEAINQLSKNGIFAGILLMPVLPFIADSKENILKIINLAAQNGAKFIYPYFGVTLRQSQRDFFYNNLDKEFKGIKERYIKEYGFSYDCPSIRGKELWQLFKSECDRLGMLYKMKDIIRAYKEAYEEEQLSLF
jgi:DNA repair photolyase